MTPLYDLLRRLLQELAEWRAVRRAQVEADRRAAQDVTALLAALSVIADRLDALERRLDDIKAPTEPTI